jgi:hypothetical protein
MFSLKSYFLCITNIEIVQNSKSKPKKFSFLCTFKSGEGTGGGGEGDEGATISEINLVPVIYIMEGVYPTPPPPPLPQQKGRMKRIFGSWFDGRASLANFTVGLAAFLPFCGLFFRCFGRYTNSSSC